MEIDHLQWLKISGKKVVLKYEYKSVEHVVKILLQSFEYFFCYGRSITRGRVVGECARGKAGVVGRDITPLLTPNPASLSISNTPIGVVIARF